MFVSNFTTVDHEKLRKLYKKTASKRRDDEDKDRSEVVFPKPFFGILDLWLCWLYLLIGKNREF